MTLVPRPLTLFALALAAAMAGASCGKCGDAGGQDAAVAAVELPVPAPAGLLADLYAGSPNASWGKLQRGVGGAVGILPASAGGIICAAAGLDPAIAAEIDGASPIYGAIVGDPGAPGFALAMKVFDLRKARGLLVDGDTARYDARDVAGMTELVPKGDHGEAKKPGSRRGGGSDGPAAFGLTKGSYLVVARSSDDLAKLGPYVSRTLPTRPLPEAGALVLDVSRESIASVLKPKVTELWEGAKAYLLAEDVRMRRDRGGRAPDFGDPTAIVGVLDGYVRDRVAVLGDLDKLRITLDVVDEGVAIDAAMIPAAGAGPARAWADSMTTGDTAPLATLPATSAVSILLRDDEKARAAQLQGLEKAVATSLGSRLAEEDGKKLHDLVEGWTKAGPSVLTGTLLSDEPQGLVVRGAVREPDAATAAVKETIDLLRIAPFKQVLRIKDVSSAADELSGVGKVARATIAREARREPTKGKTGDKDAPAAAKSDPCAVAWVAEGGALSVATRCASDEPLPLLRAGVRPEKKIADDLAFARPLQALGATASTVVVVQPLKLDPKRANLPTAPLVLAIGRRNEDAFFRIDVAHGVLRELARWQMGL